MDTYLKSSIIYLPTAVIYQFCSDKWRINRLIHFIISRLVMQLNHFYPPQTPSSPALSHLSLSSSLFYPQYLPNTSTSSIFFQFSLTLNRNHFWSHINLLSRDFCWAINLHYVFRTSVSSVVATILFLLTPLLPHHHPTVAIIVIGNLCTRHVDDVDGRQQRNWGHHM